MAWIWYPLEPLGNRKGFHGFHPRLLHKCGTPGTRAETPRVPLMKDVNPLINKALRKSGTRGTPDYSVAPDFSGMAKAIRPKGYSDEKWLAAVADTERLGYPPREAAQ
jgi:hypothetical protein